MVTITDEIILNLEDLLLIHSSPCTARFAMRKSGGKSKCENVRRAS
jgi:hypothetical protein